MFPRGGKERREERCGDGVSICGDERLSVSLLGWYGGDRFKAIQLRASIVVE